MIGASVVSRFHGLAMGAILVGTTLLPCPSTSADEPATWIARPETVRGYATRTDVEVREDHVPSYTLPEVLGEIDRQAPKDEQQQAWNDRRETLLDVFRNNAYGQAVPAPTKLEVETIEVAPLASVPGGVRERRRVTATLEGGEFDFEYVLYAKQSQQSPLFVMINNRDPELSSPEGEEFIGFLPVPEILKAGCAVAVFHHSHVAPDNPEHFREGVLSVVLPEGPRAADAPGAITAWSWGASRVLDSLSDHPLVDAERAAIIGHSRGGKTALWTGACDPRFSLVISNNSGCMGAALSRRAYGETVNIISRTFDYWFCPQLQEYGDRVAELPIDQHQLIALCAPRNVYVASAGDDLWADPRGEWLGLVNASPAFELIGSESLDTSDTMPVLGQPVTRGCTSYHIRPGRHNLTLWDWQQYLRVARDIWKIGETP
ncbi:alpha/beta hydrolase family protein [Aeoliella mucimassa]|uniref:4-O-methyl-glucuronoyl methylesterase-like domain-containing protein n=1 Tax=Aeoliella mucimassa TaxID=2527972 RepID=A0A518AV94_9BACT|nr:acetylxylan esterase [Aeoliella mucimassa]QDU58636.1 hypothetical protein Pan181_48750 [Aeoliella mucimassa]